jgi:hypothetical protein
LGENQGEANGLVGDPETERKGGEEEAQVQGNVEMERTRARKVDREDARTPELGPDRKPVVGR